jgi:uncharacterized protein (TIGR03435 family)
VKQIALTIAMTSLLLAQAKFEVASVKPTSTRDGSLAVNFLPGGGFSARNLTAQDLMRNAYGVEGYQISGAPPWMTSVGFDIQAKAPAGPIEPTREQVKKMIQTLLADRFHLTLHRETRQLPIFALVVGKTGPRLHEADNSPGPTITKLGKIVVRKMSMATLASILTFDLKRPVKDETGLPGEFAFTLEWSPGLGEPDDQPSLFAAVQEQLGLRLESTKAPIEVFVIDHVEKSAEN